MKRRLTLGESLAMTSMLFGLFFGAGNLIFPVSLGQAAGHSVWAALLGFLISAAGMPLLAVTALGITQSSGVLELSSHAGKFYSYAFSCALYLCIGPLFAIPRCITVPHEVGIVPMLSASVNPKVTLALFSFCMFGAILWFSLRPTKILVWVGKIFNPLLLMMLLWLTVRALLNPMGGFAQFEPQAEYASNAFLKGILEGYNTMDALAGLAFGIVVINVLKGLKVEAPEEIALYTVETGFFSCLLMGVIYAALALIGAQSRGLFGVSPNGGVALGLISKHYFTGFGNLFLALTVLLACLKTAIGLIVSCSETFCRMFPHTMSYRKWAVLFSVISFVLANTGLTMIIKLAVPVLVTLYPLAIALIAVSLATRGRLYGKRAMALILFFTLVGALADSFCTSSASSLAAAARRYIPFVSYGFGWVNFMFAGWILALLTGVGARR